MESKGNMNNPFKNLDNSGTTKMLSATVETASQVVSIVDSDTLATLANTTQTINNIMPTDSLKTMNEMAKTTKEVVTPNFDTSYMNNIFSAVNLVGNDPEILQFQAALKRCNSLENLDPNVFQGYLNAFGDQWENAKSATDPLRKTIAAPNLAIIRLFPNHKKLDLPQESKSALTGLTKDAAKGLAQTKDIVFNTEDELFHKVETPDQKLTANQITVAGSAQWVFEDISVDELLSFESKLFENSMLAIKDPVGKKIFSKLENWTDFIDFGEYMYYHARCFSGNTPYLDQEMLKAPENVSSQGRYNQIGRSCYYITDSEAGAINEIRKHNRKKSMKIQIAGLRAKEKAKILDLSCKVRDKDHFLEHLRFTVDNDSGKVVREYLLPNFVAECCKYLKIDGIKYKSSMDAKYNCIVLWKDGYFDFVSGSRKIVPCRKQTL